MTGHADRQSLVRDQYLALASLLEGLPDQAWDSPSLCEGWHVREVIAHVTMPARMTAEQYGAELAAAGGDFTRLSDTVAVRDAGLSRDKHLSNLRSATLHAWAPPGGGAIGALTHAVIHGLDITCALGLPRVSTDEAIRVVLDSVAGGGGHQLFGLTLEGCRLRATDLDWSYGTGTCIDEDAGDLVAMICGRTLPNGRNLHRLQQRA